jgi:triphosphoribosyl-dephospho-CoA synthetase
MSNTTTDSALLAEIPTAIASAEEATKAAKTIGERTKALASKQAWEKVAQLADRVITRGRETYRPALEEKLAYAREVDATPATAERFTN